MMSLPKNIYQKENQDYGQIIPSTQIKSEQRLRWAQRQSRTVDILFTPDKEVSTSMETLGLLGKILQTIY